MCRQVPLSMTWSRTVWKKTCIRNKIPHSQYKLFMHSCLVHGLFFSSILMLTILFFIKIIGVALEETCWAQDIRKEPLHFKVPSKFPPPHPHPDTLVFLNSSILILWARFSEIWNRVYGKFPFKAVAMFC